MVRSICLIHPCALTCHFMTVWPYSLESARQGMFWQWKINRYHYPSGPSASNQSSDFGLRVPRSTSDYEVASGGRSGPGCRSGRWKIRPCGLLAARCVVFWDLTLCALSSSVASSSTISIQTVRVISSTIDHQSVRCVTFRVYHLEGCIERRTLRAQHFIPLIYRL